MVCWNILLVNMLMVLEAARAFNLFAPHELVSSSVRGTSVRACTPPLVMVSASGVRECECDVGYYFNSGNSACEPCLSGQYKPATGNTSCLACPAHSISVSGASSCQCVTGYTFDSGSSVCSPCTNTQYKSVVGNASCSACPGNTVVQVSAADSLENCLCNAGFTPDNPAQATCKQCAPGKYKNSIGLSDCSLCDSNANSPPGSTAAAACACNAGYTGANGGTCTACLRGQYKSNPGSAPCSTCSANSYTAAEAQTEQTSCKCDTGYTGPDGGTCTACVAGKFKNAVGSAVCLNCAQDDFAVAGSDACSDCPAHSTVAEGAGVDLASCLCNAGYQPASGGGCEACSAGTYKDSVGTQTCQNCDAGSYSTTQSSTACESCMLDATSDAGSDARNDCRCNPGFTLQADACNKCAAGTYKTSTSNAACTPCAKDTYNTQTGSTSADACTGCPEHSGTEEQTGQTAQAACTCNAGYESGGAYCQVCEGGFYCEGSSQKQKCGDYSTSNPQSSAVSACVCNAGYVGQDGVCAVCPANNFCPGGAVQTLCPGNSTAERNSDSEDDCVCVSGFHRN